MNINSLQAQQLTDVSRTSGLRKAAEMVAPPKLSQDEHEYDLQRVSGREKP